MTGLEIALVLIFVVLAWAAVVIAWVSSRHMSASQQAKAALTASTEYRGLADEYRRLSDMAITAQEHNELTLTDLSVQLSELRDTMDRMERILKDVE